MRLGKGVDRVHLRQLRGILQILRGSIPQIASLVGTLERRHGLALVLIQGVGLDGTVAELDLTVGLLLPGESVLHPVLIVTVGVVLTGVGTARLLTGSGGSSGLGTGNDVSKCF